MDNNILAFIGLMKRAGCLAAGGENVYDAAREGRARLILAAADCGPNTPPTNARPLWSAWIAAKSSWARPWE